MFLQRIPKTSYKTIVAGTKFKFVSNAILVVISVLDLKLQTAVCALTSSKLKSTFTKWSQLSVSLIITSD